MVPSQGRHWLLVEQGVVVAKRVVVQRFPDARAAWLGGSVAARQQTWLAELPPAGPTVQLRASNPRSKNVDTKVRITGVDID
jgi:hypothetical protein